MKIEELLEKYFEGDTSAAEEKWLRAFFASTDVPEEFLPYKAMFAYFDEEIAVAKKPAKRFFIRPAYRILLGVAASLLILLGVYGTWFLQGTRFCAENYVVINGRCYTDMHTIRTVAFDALQEFSSPSDMVESDVIQMQLQEFSFMFNEDE